MQLCKIIAIVTVSVLFCMAVPEGGVHAQPPSQTGICKIASIQGKVTAKRNGSMEWSPVHVDEVFFPGDRILTGRNCRVAIVLSNDTVLRIDQNTTIVFLGHQEKRSFLIDLLHGAVHFFSRKARSLKVTTPFVNAAVEGTEFFVSVDQDQTLISLFEGRVRADNAQGSLLLTKGQSAVARLDQPPELKLIVRPRDAVQWTLYYPPIIAYRPDDMPAVAEHLRSKLSQSVGAYQQGDLNRAFTLVEDLSKEVYDARLYVYRANLSLAVGRVPEALADIEKALALEADNSQALALRSIIAVIQNRKDAAYADAQKAVDLNPNSPSALLALSYANQAGFNLSAAVDAAESAVAKAPDHAIAHARLAELRLSTDDPDGAVRAAKKAVALDPNIARAQTVLGFAKLSRMKMAASKKAFTKAIQIDSAAPLPRLGLGLVKIRQGRLKEGRGEIEIAAALDPGNALMRSYLGKAYFDEKRRPLEARQLEIAKSLDPQDPTPWYYDAIRKQTQNRPVDALHDLQKSIELNNNRAVYRSRLLMDEDLAARSASLGRIYNDLGFQELALRQGWRSLHADPSNYSAHRLLADSYSSRPRYEIARVSELLQAQLLQPLSITPVQPQLAESNLQILEGAGPGSVSFNEFNPLFARNRVAAQASGLAGDNGTWGDEVAVAGLYNRFSGSAGQYHYETNGFRQNNDLDQDIYSVFAQAALTPKINVQAEYRHKRDRHGDLDFSWDLDNPDVTLHTDAESDTMRAGIHLKPAMHSDVIGSVIFRDRNVNRKSILSLTFPFPMEVPFNSDVESESVSSEVQYLYNSPMVDIIVGGGYYDIDRQIAINGVDSDEETSEHGNGYIYTHIRYPDHLTWTIGASFDSLDEHIQIDTKEFNPKLGINLDLSKDTNIRIAAFRGVKRILVADQTIEPTHIAGFNQFFDDVNATEQELYGIGVDHKFSAHIYGGLEYYFRDLNRPILKSTSAVWENWDEDVFRSYFYWTVHRELVVGLECEYQKFQADIIEAVNVPEEMETFKIPINVSYHHPLGGFGRLVTTYVDQEVVSLEIPDESLHDDFVLVDIAAGYRLPKRYGIISAEIRNLFDQNFNYLDDAKRSSQTFIAPLYHPERTFMLRLTLSF